MNTKMKTLLTRLGVQGKLARAERDQYKEEITSFINTIIKDKAILDQKERELFLKALKRDVYGAVLFVKRLADFRFDEVFFQFILKELDSIYLAGSEAYQKARKEFQKREGATEKFVLFSQEPLDKRQRELLDELELPTKAVTLRAVTKSDDHILALVPLISPETQKNSKPSSAMPLEIFMHLLADANTIGRLVIHVQKDLKGYFANADQTTFKKLVSNNPDYSELVLKHYLKNPAQIPIALLSVLDNKTFCSAISSSPLKHLWRRLFNKSHPSLAIDADELTRRALSDGSFATEVLFKVNRFTPNLWEKLEDKHWQCLAFNLKDKSILTDAFLNKIAKVRFRDPASAKAFITSIRAVNSDSSWERLNLNGLYKSAPSREVGLNKKITESQLRASENKVIELAEAKVKDSISEISSKLDGLLEGEKSQRTQVDQWIRHMNSATLEVQAFEATQKSTNEELRKLIGEIAAAFNILQTKLPGAVRAEIERSAQKNAVLKQLEESRRHTMALTEVVTNLQRQLDAIQNQQGVSSTATMIRGGLFGSSLNAEDAYRSEEAAEKPQIYEIGTPGTPSEKPTDLWAGVWSPISGGSSEGRESARRNTQDSPYASPRR